MRKKILVVEDDEDILEMLGFILKEEGYEVVLSEDGAACAHLLKILPDLILMDIRLKDTEHSGDTICLLLKSQLATRCFPVILLSAERDLPALSKSCGADAFMSKPFDVAALMKKIREMISLS